MVIKYFYSSVKHKDTDSPIITSIPSLENYK